MRLYHHLPKRIAKKHMRYSWFKLNYAKNLKPGDLISTCVGYNERIKEIIPVWTRYGLSKGRYIIDFNIFTDKHSCSLCCCCTCPTETLEEVMEYWTSWIPTWEREVDRSKPWNKTICYIMDGIIAGRQVFNEHGELLW